MTTTTDVARAVTVDKTPTVRSEGGGEKTNKACAQSKENYNFITLSTEHRGYYTVQVSCLGKLGNGTYLCHYIN